MRNSGGLFVGAVVKIPNPPMPEPLVSQLMKCFRNKDKKNIKKLNQKIFKNN